MENNIKDFSNWQKKINQVCSCLLEDNQVMSLPTIVIQNGKKYFFTFVFSVNIEKNSITVLQHHFWSGSEHNMTICQQSYNIDRVDLLILHNVEYQEKYFNKLLSIYDFAFQGGLSKKALLDIYDFIDTIKISGTILNVSEKENPKFFDWIQSVNYFRKFEL